ncbi:MAG: helix-turn-helix transcriptional regulator [Alcaligenaceae bacterium]|nr:helix-turn-helix transcriptional regulator [Alcaligenaceae bacterium]
MATIQKLSGKLRRQLSILKTTQAALRERAGLSRRTMTNVFSGEADFKVSTLLAVADELGLDVVLVPKDAARAIDLDLSPTAPKVLTGVQAALDRLAQAGPKAKAHKGGA